MPRKPKPPPDDPEQSKRFIEMAREIGADASKEEFERAFKRVASSKRASTKPDIPKRHPVRRKPDGHD
jgi:hypothetical protein